jgi:hypothetical protein
VATRETAKAVFENVIVCLGAEGVAGEGECAFDLCGRGYFCWEDAARDQVGTGLASGIFECASDDKGGAAGEKEAEHAAVEFPEAVFHAEWAAVVVVPGEASVDEERVDGDYYDGADDRYEKQECDGDALGDGVGVVQGVVFEGKGLVEGFDGVESPEGEEEDSTLQSVNRFWPIL